jgi:outer membrane protein assembly factor BamB
MTMYLARLFCGITACIFTIAITASAEDWTRFRGPNGSGVSVATGYPIDLSNRKSLVWKSPVRPGKSSPVLTDLHLFLTAFQDKHLYTQCFDRASGKLLWERSEPWGQTRILHELNEPASITPVTDGENVFVFFRDVGILSYDPQGNLRWKVPLGPFTNAEGLAASPIIAGRLLILVVDQHMDAYIAAFDIDTGKTQWRTPRTRYSGWATPILRKIPSGDLEVVTVSAKFFEGYSAATGKQTWSHEGLSQAVIASPVIDQDTVFAFSYGYEDDSPFSAVLKGADLNSDGRIQADEIRGDSWLYQIAWFKGNRDGTVTREEWDEATRELRMPSSLTAFHIDPATHGKPGRELWRYEKSLIGVVPSPLLYRDALYVVKNGGILTSFDPKTGKVLKKGRLHDAIESYFASPVAADGKIYFVSEAGKVVVVRADREWQVISVHPLGEEAYATPALSRGQIFLRTTEHLYCFDAPGR